LDHDLFRQDHFIKNIDSYDWSALKGKRVLVRGCQSALIPPKAFIYLTGKLTGYARVVSYGSEHNHIVVFKSTESS
jgi:hypothetical protein